ncbi:hypothetical protein EDD18DRAFT_1357013 [Armillaria luteobubalina]|uniref:Uncharacterized protein n=1 Tax=Armillaria luteobubalina TaxID=153913 RepID=A0AA39UQK9_9AGAR|nr:hypothetical protein EDD18DRAFT_1357013 [Armillaria luteobubalina]
MPPFIRFLPAGLNAWLGFHTRKRPVPIKLSPPISVIFNGAHVWYMLSVLPTFERAVVNHEVRQFCTALFNVWFNVFPEEEDKYNDEEREGQILQHRKEGIVHYLTKFLEQIWFGFDAPCQGPLEDDRMLEFLAELREFVEQGVPL